MVQITPLLSVALLLLCLFAGGLVFSPAAREVAVDLPVQAGGLPVEHHPGELVIAITHAGGLMVNRQTLTLDELRGRLRQFSHDVPESVVLVQADHSTPLQRIIEVLDACRNAEIDKCSFVAIVGGSE